LIPVYCEILADLETPVSALLKIDDGQSAFLLESVEGVNLGRYSFLGASPSIIFQSKGKQITIHERGKVRAYELERGDPLDELRGLMNRYHAALRRDCRRFSAARWATPVTTWCISSRISP
jgi:anthranilate synthase component 1